MKYKTVYLSVGTNIGDRFLNILRAIEKLNQMKKTLIIKIAPVYETAPIGYLNQDDFLNTAIKIKPKLKPFELLREINRIESELGRVRKIHWGPRTVDIDIIFYNNIKIKREKLTIPHKEYKKRNFVMIPLRRIGVKNLSRYIGTEKGKLREYRYNEKILISSCLLGLNTRYDGTGNQKSYLRDFLKNYNIIPVCPEQLGGLETPRTPCERIGRKIISKKGEDFTYKFEKGAVETIKAAKLFNSKIAVLKAKSPSCGFGKIYSGEFNGKLIDGNGLAAEKMIKNGIEIVSI